VNFEFKLTGVGLLGSGAFGAVNLTSAPANALTLLCMSLGSSPVPFKGGVLKAYPLLLGMPFLTDGTGSLLLSYFAPIDVPAHLELVVQMLIKDPGAVHGVALSTALKVVTP